ncbi:MAG: (Fe-S)-binding protein [Spirochaetota bacterium]|nr:(Fe-S)-binding protein [Spirochaetota bacterium]
MSTSSFILLLLIFISVGWFGYRVTQLLWVLRLGQPEDRFDNIAQRIMNVVIFVLGQRRVVKEISGWGHFFIFWGFVVIQIGALELFAQGFFRDFKYDKIAEELIGTPIIGEILYLIIDIICFIVLIALMIGLVRRYMLKPVRLEAKDPHAKVDATVIIILISLIILTLFGINGAELSEKLAEDNFSAIDRFNMIQIAGLRLDLFMPISSLFSYLFSGASHTTAESIRDVFWWIHIIIILGFLVYIPYSKHLHLLGAIPNVFFKSSKPVGELAQLDIDDEEAETFGAYRIEDFTWKQMLDLYACTECGRCQENCPAYLTDKPLSPKELIHDLKLNLLKRGLMLIEDEKERETDEAKEYLEKPLVDGILEEEAIWACTNCMNCQEHCPVFIEHVQKIIDIRRYQVLTEGKMATELQTTFTNMENNYNPYGFAFAARADWVTEDLGLKTLSEDSEVDYLYFVGCAASYDKRNQDIARLLVKILKKAGLKVGILGSEEACCGDSALRAGNEYLFQTLVTQNIETLNSYNVKKIITTCPHGFNVIKNEYPKYGGNYEVYHHIDLLANLIEEGKLTLTNPVNEKVAYHDSCFLGRYNEIYLAPRKILQAIPGIELVEMSKNHNKSICCGAGGSRMWIEEKIGKRINQYRTEDFKNSGANVVATACPFCMTMLSDGIVEIGLDENTYSAYDILELVDKALA